MKVILSAIAIVISVMSLAASVAGASPFDNQQGHDVGYRIGESDGRKDGRGPNCSLGPVNDEARRQRVAGYLKSQPDNEDFGRGFRDGYAVGYDKAFLSTRRLQCKSPALKAASTEEVHDSKKVQTGSASSDAGAPATPDSGQKKAR